MTVEVDYGAGVIYYDVNATPAFTDPTSEQVQARGDQVYGYLLDMEATADFAAEAALQKIEALRNFDAAVGTVTFVVPDAPFSLLQNVPDIPALALSEPIVSKSDLDTAFRWNAPTEPRTQGWESPDDPVYSAPERPGLTTPGTLPNAPADYDFPSVAPPVLDIGSFSPTTVTPPQIDLIDFEYNAGIDIEPLDDLIVDTSGLEAAIAAYEDYDPTPPELPEYMYLIPEIFSVTGSMAAGNTIVDYVRLLEARQGLLQSTVPSTALSFQRRGLTSVTGSPEYDTWLNKKTHATLDASDIVFEAKAVNDCVEAAFQLGTAAHRLLVDIETALYDLEFSAAKAIVQGQLVRAQAVAAIYNANVLILQNAIAGYNAQAAAITGAARAFEVQAREAGILAQANSTLADSFSATERAKQVEGRVYKARVEAEAAKLLQYRAFLETYEAAVQAARADVEQFSGDVSRYSAEIDRLASEYRLYSSEAQATVAQNAALAATSKASQAEFRALASQADSSATAAAARAVGLQARAAVRETQYIKRALHNEEEGVESNRRAGAYNTDITQYISELAERQVVFGGMSAQARSIASYVTTASEQVGRSATLTQTANTTLARAYAQVYEAAGRAGAAVASGKLSGFRASATMSANEAIQASRSYGVAVGATGGTSYGESENYNASFTPP